MVIQSDGCDQEGRRLSEETGVKQVSFQVFPEGFNYGRVLGPSKIFFSIF